MSKLSLDKLQRVSNAAKDVILTLADKHSDHGKSDDKMVELWDHLNDKAAPPEVVKAMADELIALRKHNQAIKQQRILDRRRFATGTVTMPGNAVIQMRQCHQYPEDSKK